MEKEKREVIRYKKLTGTTKQKREQFKKQLSKFEEDAKKGKLICLTDLMINGENIINN